MLQKQVHRLLKIIPAILLPLFLSSQATADDFCQSYKMKEYLSDSQPFSLASNIWRVEASNGAKGYILGVMHLPGQQTNNRYDLVVPLIHNADTYLAELPLDFESIRTFQRAALADNQSFRIQFPEHWELLASKLAKKSKISRPESQAVWSLTSSLSRPPMKSVTLDGHLWNIAGRMGKRIKAIQSMDEFLLSLKSIPSQIENEILAEVVCNYDELQENVLKQMQAYRDEDWTRWYIESLRLKSTNSRLNNSFEKALVIDRNLVAIDKIENELKNRSDFFLTIGLAHLPGNKGIINGLSEKGYRVTPLSYDELEEISAQISEEILMTWEPKMLHLLKWVNKLSKYDLPSQLGAEHLPKIRFLTQEQMQIRACEGEDCPVFGHFQDGDLALSYSLFPGIASDSLIELSIALHELVHWAQEKWGTSTNQYGDCREFRAREFEASSVQNRFLLAHGKLSPAPAFAPPCQ